MNQCGPRRDRAAVRAGGGDALLVPVLTAWHDAAVERWHRDAAEAQRFFERGPREATGGLADLSGAIGEGHLANILIWHEEDEARRTDVPDSVVAATKRRIDALNQLRNDLVERVDDRLLEIVERAGAAPERTPLHSETPGAIVDRLSILALKIYHMSEEAGRAEASPAHRAASGAKRAVLLRQRADLGGCLEDLLREATAGRRRLPRYRQYKMYNDPETNPALRRAAQRAEGA